jgi:NAD(P)-dependent dehydrogenase (short-subunit alcohol dehydrogenase family)
MKIAVISGGSSGIGEACVKKFHANGWFIFNLDIKNNSKFANLSNYWWLDTNVAEEVEIVQAINKIITAKNRIDVVIVSAGKHLSASIENTSNEQLLDLVNLNLFGSYWLIKHSIPIMKSQHMGNIITIGSDQSSIAKANSVVYGMTKAALAHLTKSIALDYAKYNIRANCIGVGTVDTPLYRAAIEQYSTSSGIPVQQIEQEEAQEQPIGRIGKPEEVAELAYFLAQDNVAYITGALIPMDGGYTIR